MARVVGRASSIGTPRARRQQSANAGAATSRPAQRLLRSGSNVPSHTNPVLCDRCARRSCMSVHPLTANGICRRWTQMDADTAIQSRCRIRVHLRLSAAAFRAVAVSHGRTTMEVASALRLTLPARVRGSRAIVEFAISQVTAPAGAANRMVIAGGHGTRSLHTRGPIWLGTTEDAGSVRMRGRAP